MQTDKVIFSTVPIEALVSEIAARVIESLKADQDSRDQDRLLGTKEVCDLFKVTPVTVSAYIKKGLLKPHVMGGRNHFKYSEVMESLKTYKRYKPN